MQFSHLKILHESPKTCALNSRRKFANASLFSCIFARALPAKSTAHKYCTSQILHKACTNTAEILHKSCTDSGGKSAAHKYHNTSPLHHNLPNSGKTASARAQKRLLGIIRIHSDVLKFLLSVHQEGLRSIHISDRASYTHREQAQNICKTINRAFPPN